MLQLVKNTYKCNKMRNLKDTWCLRGNPHGKNHGLVSKPHSNLESTKYEMITTYSRLNDLISINNHHTYLIPV